MSGSSFVPPEGITSVTVPSLRRPATRRPSRITERDYPAGLVEYGVVRIGGQQRHLAALAAQHRRVEPVRFRREGVLGQPVEHEPSTYLDLGLKLADTPAGVPGEHP